VPASVDAELTRLAPAKIVVVGGSNAVSDVVFSQLAAHQPNIVRLAGADRYETSRMIADVAFSKDLGVAYVATGANFPDALSAGAVAGSKHVPVILVNGVAESVDADTLALLRRLHVTQATIVGGPSAVSPALAASLQENVASVSRISGDTRFETSSLLNSASFKDGAPTVFLATGYSFPDALAGAAAAGAAHSPLYVVPTACVPSATATDVFTLRASTVELLGGTNALSDTVGQLRDCR
jgi:putative cell wall-binding protein